MLRRLIADQQHGSHAPAAPVAASPLDQLRQLAGLRDAGIVTQAEFDAKKADLLGLGGGPSAAQQAGSVRGKATFCTQCGTKLTEAVAFCPQCGARQEAHAT